ARHRVPQEPPASTRAVRDDLAEITPTAHRSLYFSETLPTARGSDEGQSFFITVTGAMPAIYHPSDPPAIVTTQGAVEEWTIENRTAEVHEFHLHQVHFLLMAINSVPVPEEQRQYLDVVSIPYFTGTGPIPSVTVRLDFRGPLTGDFLFHCHI